MPDYKTVQEVKAIDPALAAPFRSILILRRKTTKTAKNGNPFLSIELGDAGGSFTANCFGDSAIYKALEPVAEGSIIRVSGKTEYYQERFSPRLQAAEVIDAEEASAEGMMANLVETPPESEEELWQHIQEAVEAIQHPQLKETVQRVLEELGERFRTCPAAVSMHHAYYNGLLEHTTHMVRAARALLPLYPEVDHDLAIAGIILHDMGKLEEYEGEFAAKVSRIGTLQGHVVIGFRIARKAALQSKLNADLTERLEHIILSHQGEKEWGAAAMAATPEAVFVSMVDNLDAKMGMVQRVLRNTPEGEAFSDYLAGLQTRVLVTPPDKS
ncbi:3'-5' exoribonuclease YhaM family protein [Coraliomargarita akajimensis]|uniref:Metal dependent phosphohydrolase n=1 Tax=Coraliomargarita akajimensis (strain DSM 45221 / IAM 15411 / JCM 23193 / KCTC 12865 / 04OKA010-24) TaxID=583355 RepID=D5EJG8_CORAD|nr:HD domain-containing protein [Coraliomargarita akajimensis]ADE54567.1 metal dependent phosphohydrolase [Coraliomargarita akajimensis DSM 45221]